MKIHLTRHGQAISFGHYKVLSTLGREQARMLARRLGDEGFAGPIHASPYLHTLETAQVMAEVLGVRVIPCVGIREIVSNAETFAARFVGATAEQMKALCPLVETPTDLPYPWWTCEQETSDDVEVRVAPVIETMCPPDEPICLVGHGASIGAAIRHLRKKGGMESNAPDRQPLLNCALTTFRFDGDAVELERECDLGHLPTDVWTSNEMSHAEACEELRRRSAAAEATLYTTDHEASSRAAR